MQQTEPITFGSYYHIYNPGINSCNLFQETDNYFTFMKLYEKHLDVVAHTAVHDRTINVEAIDK